MKNYSASGERIVIGYIKGKKGQYEVFHRGSFGDLYFQNPFGSIATKFRKKDTGKYIGPDGTVYYNNESVIVAIQNRYNLGKYS